MSNIDILHIDSEIKNEFKKNYEQLPEKHSRMLEINSELLNEDLSRKEKLTLRKQREKIGIEIKNIESKNEMKLYLSESLPLICEYKEILRTPMKINFMGKSSKNNKKKKTVIQKYLDIANKYSNNYYELKNSQKMICSNCPNKKDFEIYENEVAICKKCFSRQRLLSYNSSYNDIDRVNISSKYMYERKIHFRDCIYQYQGKQNSTIGQNVYDDLEEQFDRHHLLIGDEKTPKEERFANITKKHILIFLKELGYSKHYENVHLIHYKFTGIKPDDISHLEQSLLDDFDILNNEYNKLPDKDVKRKNFINTQYVLYQLLCRHRHRCNKEEFIILKTTDRKFFHDKICKKLFKKLNWNFTPTY